MKHFFLLFSLFSLACSGGDTKVDTKPIEKNIVPETGQTLGSGIDLNGANPTVSANDDFYEHVNGTWLKTTKLPADKSNYGAFTKVSDEAEIHLREIVLEVSAKKNLEQGSPDQKIRDYYNAYLVAAEKTSADITGIETELKKIDAIKNRTDFYRIVGELAPLGVRTPIRISMFSDLKDPNTYTVYLSQSGLTLRDRDYYIKDEDRFKKGRDLYIVYADALLNVGGFKPAGKSLLAFEKRLAEVSWTREELRDPTKQYNPKTIAEMKKLAPKIGWEKLLEGTSIPAREKYIIATPSFFEKTNTIIAKTKVSTLKNYLRFQTISRFASLLGKPAFDANFAFRRKGLRGVKEPRPAWKRAISGMNWSLGELLGQLYVAKHFKPEAKTRMVKMVETLTAAYGASIKDLDWMSEETKVAALDKLSKFNPKIGYPDKWLDYSALSISTNAIENSKNIAMFEFNRDIGKLSKPVDKTEWGMPPQIVNAYYNPVWNEIVFPAAILQPPFFDLDADDAANYGAIGAVIGHEIGHGFDDQGRKFDGDGTLRDWWTPDDTTKFDEKKNKLAAQYNAFKVIDELTVNGEFTSGENIGDLGGLSIAYKAYRMSLNGKEAPVIDGLTGDQRFFMGWAQVWRRLYTDEDLKRKLVVDPHSPGKARTNVILKNVPEFYEAFGVKEGDGMYLEPKDRVKIW